MSYVVGVPVYHLLVGPFITAPEWSPCLHSWHHLPLSPTHWPSAAYVMLLKHLFKTTFWLKPFFWHPRDEGPTPSHIRLCSYGSFQLPTYISHTSFTTVPRRPLNSPPYLGPLHMQFPVSTALPRHVYMTPPLSSKLDENLWGISLISSLSDSLHLAEWGVPLQCTQCHPVTHVTILS